MGNSGDHTFDEKKIILAAKKDKRNFRFLYEHYYEQIFLFILKRTANENLTADLTQQSFVKAMMNIDKFKDIGFPFSSWLYRIALNEINLFYRNNKFKRVIEIDNSDITLVQEEIEEDNYELNLSKLVNSFQILSPDEVTLLEMKYFEKRQFKEISEILGINVGNAKVKLHRIIKKLKKHIFEKE